MHAELIQLAIRTTGRGRCRVTLSGELDVSTAPAVREVLQDAVREHRRVDTDVSGLTFCDCSGLSALLAAANTAFECGSDLRLCDVPPFFARFLRLSRTINAFTLVEAPSPHPAPARVHYLREGLRTEWPDVAAV